MADPPVVLDKEEKAALVASAVQKVSIVLLLMVAELSIFCKLQLIHHGFARSKINAQVVNHHLKPADALILVNHGRPAGIKDYDLSRALAKLVSDVAEEWLNLEEEMLLDIDSSDSAAVAALYHHTKKVLIPKPLIASKGFMGYFPGGDLSHFQSKVVSEVKKFKARRSNELQPPPQQPNLQDVTNRPEAIKTRRTGKQQNVHWQNENARRKATAENYDAAFSAAVTAFRAKRDKSAEEKRTQDQIIEDLNRQFNLNGDGKEGSREKNMLAKSTINRYLDKGDFGDGQPLVKRKKKGKSATISRNWKELVAIHINLTQVSTIGEADIATIKATVRASVQGTAHEGTFDLNWAWKDIRRLHADTLVPTGFLAAEDIRREWCTYTNMKTYTTDYMVR
jgi:hypothetical protein